MWCTQDLPTNNDRHVFSYYLLDHEASPRWPWCQYHLAAAQHRINCVRITPGADGFSITWKEWLESVGARLWNSSSTSIIASLNVFKALPAMILKLRLNSVPTLPSLTQTSVWYLAEPRFERHQTTLQWCQSEATHPYANFWLEFKNHIASQLLREPTWCTIKFILTDKAVVICNKDSLELSASTPWIVNGVAKNHGRPFRLDCGTWECSKRYFPLVYQLFFTLIR